MKPINNINTQHDRQWYQYKQNQDKFGNKYIVEQPCSFQEALDKAYKEYKLIQENDARRK
jgi:hypothetical protein